MISKLPLIQSSGSELLDQAALDTVMRAQPLPRIPPGLAGPMAIELPVDFALTS